jgi:tetratricopeptide (TPR) repeat protein
LKTTLWECLEYYELNGRMTEAAMILMDATYIATISESFSEALGYISRAITIIENEQLLELLAQAQFSKGNLLQTWAQNGNPQFYRAAVQSYQAALKTFTKEDYPDIFAEIHHQLGKVYAEIPDEVKKKGVWAAVSVSSFNEALNYYNKIDFPYQFAMICNSMGNAYTKYPAALHTDNFDKALAWYREALDIRTTATYPLERVLTLCNYLEASWFVGNKEEFDEDRFNEMMNVANEIILLSNDEKILNSAKNDIQRLEALKAETQN